MAQTRRTMADRAHRPRQERQDSKDVPCRRLRLLLCRILAPDAADAAELPRQGFVPLRGL